MRRRQGRLQITADLCGQRSLVFLGCVRADRVVLLAGLRTERGGRRRVRRPLRRRRAPAADNDEATRPERSRRALGSADRDLDRWAGGMGRAVMMTQKLT